MTNMFAKPKRLSDAVIDQIRDTIITRQMQPGDRLPTEQQWVDSLGVSRASVREAIKALGYLGVVKSAPKRGTTVGELDISRVVKLLEFQFAVNELPREQLLKTREIIECGAMPYISERLMEDEALFDRLYALTEIPGLEEDLDIYIEADIQFHHGLVEASGVAPVIAFQELLQAFFIRFRENIARHGRWRTMGVKFHRQILLALREGDIQRAQEIYRETYTVYRSAD